MNLRRYSFAFVFALIIVGMYFYDHSTGLKAVNITVQNFREMLLFLPPIFILVGLLDVWVPKETMIKLMGEGSGLKGIMIAFILGSAAAGPLYAAFPVAAVLIKKGARLAYVLFFLGAWSSTKLPLVIYESASLGLRFTLIHITVSIAGFLSAAFFIEKMIPARSRELIYEKTRSQEV
ncbi:permease [Thermincola potens]|uniref:Permease n=1 Tax=Thermincola potens (strain JR) TaxID=635013 RepID=D5XDZ5_THEPJ|nr:permease [Thermincola potens]ADG81866.1 conserved hypothetical protein [Thermincola potens JR]